MSPLRRVYALFSLSRAMFHLVRDPGQLDMIFDFVEKLENPEELEEVRAAMAAHPQGAAAIRDRVRVGRIDLDALHALPEGTLGRAFADHMIARGFQPDDLPILEAPDEHRYVLAHIYETHDIWHVVAGFDTDVPGELGLQAFNMAQFPGRVGLMLLAAGMLNTLIYNPDQREARLSEIARGWQLGRSCEPFFGVRWAEQWDRPLDEIREELGVYAASSSVTSSSSEPKLDATRASISSQAWSGMPSALAHSSSPSL